MLGRKPGSGSGSEPLLAGGGSSNRVQVPTALASPPYSSDSVSQSRTARARSNYSQRSLCLPPFYPTGISCRPRHVCPLAPLLLNTSCKKDHDHLFAITHFLSSSPFLSSAVPCSYIVDAGASLQAFVQASCCQLRPLSHKCKHFTVSVMALTVSSSSLLPCFLVSLLLPPSTPSGSQH